MSPATCWCVTAGGAEGGADAAGCQARAGLQGQGATLTLPATITTDGPATHTIGIHTTALPHPSSQIFLRNATKSPVAGGSLVVTLTLPAGLSLVSLDPSFTTSDSTGTIAITVGRAVPALGLLVITASLQVRAARTALRRWFAGGGSSGGYGGGSSSPVGEARLINQGLPVDHITLSPSDPVPPVVDPQACVPPVGLTTLPARLPRNADGHCGRL